MTDCLLGKIMSNNTKTFPYLCMKCKSINCTWVSAKVFHCIDCNYSSHSERADKNTTYKWSIKIPPVNDGLFGWEDYNV